MLASPYHFCTELPWESSYDAMSLLALKSAAVKHTHARPFDRWSTLLGSAAFGGALLLPLRLSTVRLPGGEVPSDLLLGSQNHFGVPQLRKIT